MNFPLPPLNLPQVPLPPKNATDTQALSEWFRSVLQPWQKRLQQSLKEWSRPVVDLGNLSVQGVGATLASAATITPTHSIHHVSGTTTIEKIDLPYMEGVDSVGGAARLVPIHTGPIFLIPDGLWDTGVVAPPDGNIAIATTAVVNQVLVMVFDGELWYPSYL